MTPTPRFEKIPGRLLKVLSFEELLTFTENVQHDLKSVRITLHEAVAELAKVTRERDQLRQWLKPRRS